MGNESLFKQCDFQPIYQEKNRLRHRSLLLHAVKAFILCRVSFFIGWAMSENIIELSGAFSEGYGIIPKKLMKSQDVSAYGKLVIAYMLSYTGAGNECFPGIETISKDLQTSKPTIIKAINELCDKKWIIKERMYPGNRMKHNNKYRLIAISTESKPRLPSRSTTFTPDCQSDLPSKVNDVYKNNNNINNNISNNNKEDTASPSSFNHRLISDRYITLHKEKVGSDRQVSWGRVWKSVSGRTDLTDESMLAGLESYFNDEWVRDKKAYDPYYWIANVDTFISKQKVSKKSERINPDNISWE